MNIKRVTFRIILYAVYVGIILWHVSYRKKKRLFENVFILWIESEFCIITMEAFINR